MVEEAHRNNTGFILYTTLKKMHIPTVHCKKKGPKKEAECGDDCQHKHVCFRIRQVFFLLEQVLAKMSEKYQIFSLLQMKTSFSFDKLQQRIKIIRRYDGSGIIFLGF